ncbi:MAG TPA: LacI family DNA-binding transcriptional regulator [Acidobacteriaceae bacterium]
MPRKTAEPKHSKAPTRVQLPVRKRATLADVARVAGVVPMTVSRAINRSGYVSEEVRARVTEAVEQLQYRPNMLARQLKGQRFYAVGVMLPDIANPFGNELVLGIKEVLDDSGYTTFITTSGGSVEKETAALQSFVDHRIDGLIVATRGSIAGDKALGEIAAQHVPIVTIGRPVESPGVDCVSVDHYRGAFEAASHLIESGHKRVGYIGIGHPEDAVPQRFEGYLAALEAAGIPFRPEYAVREVDAPAFATEEDGYLGMLELANRKQRPTAVFARNDFAAVGALRALHTLGLRVPQDIAVVGFDNIRLSAYTTPPLTTVEQPILEQGRMAARFLVERIEGKAKGKPRNVVMASKLVKRESVMKRAKA